MPLDFGLESRRKYVRLPISEDRGIAARLCQVIPRGFSTQRYSQVSRLDAVSRVEVQTIALQTRNLLCDFGSQFPVKIVCMKDG